MKMKTTAEEARHEWSWKMNCWSEITGDLLIQLEHEKRCVLVYVVDMIRRRMKTKTTLYGNHSG